jgi:hypothetical protein
MDWEKVREEGKVPWEKHGEVSVKKWDVVRAMEELVRQLDSRYAPYHCHGTEEARGQ